MKPGTELYQATHGLRPRGYGGWAFRLTFADGRVEEDYRADTYTAAWRDVLACSEKRWGSKPVKLEVLP